ncbi:conjugal transfer protein TraG [Lachnospiraceae bacterium]|jgi:type IV secretion system protein VirD4|nr:conjugal transfer protein TraG [Lachnospiraceae bacterium]
MSSIINGIAKDLKAIPKNLKAKTGNLDKKKLVLMNLPYVLAGYFCDKTACLWRVSPGQDASAKMMAVMAGMEDLFSNPLPSFYPKDLLIGAGCGIALRLVVYFKAKNAKKFRKGVEYGSARWGNAKDIEPYMDSEFENNILLTQTERLMMSGRPKQPKYARNKNILVIGGSGSGKTRFFVKPNLMQMHSSYVVTDPKGTVLVECGKMLKKGGYKIKVLNTINFAKSMHYNPFAYLRSEKDILKLANTIIVNTKGEGQQSGEDFWVKAEKLYYTALIAYIWYEAPEEEQNFAMLIDMIDASEAREDDENFKNAVDLLFDELAEKDPNHFAVRQYAKYKLAAGKTAKSILISCGARLAPFDIKELRDLMEYDDLELDTLGEQKTALFVIISDTDATFNFVVSIMYSQLFNLLCDKADDVYNGRLPVHVRMLLDEFANIGQIPQFEKLIATIRSREISASIILQSKSQLKAIYKDNSDTIEGNCDTTLFLGGKEKTTLKELEDILGKETIDLYNTSDTRGTSQSYGLNYQKTGKALMSQDEIAVMDGGKCIMQLRGVRPFFSDKFDITKHGRYKELSDYDQKNAFDIEKYVKHLQVMKVTLNTEVDEAFDCGEVKGQEGNSPDTTE